MNKSELIDHIAKKAKLSKVDSGKALNATMDAIEGELKKGRSVTLVGFGSFSVATRSARKGRNPRTGQVLNIKAAKVPKFRPGKALREMVKKGK